MTQFALRAHVCCLRVYAGDYATATEMSRLSHLFPQISMNQRHAHKKMVENVVLEKCILKY